ncbi:MAG: hypothetical protein QF362_03755 [Candidatus Woesearchaeota archaeon]|jgi:DNA repair exonuclease SbcCD ATPase subunit|nr:hypothetical protein [Candidatus Woesearchaeota archaeon]MDP7506530.1 hypothetical protein [Candidatus Woesearchaeota archaeon]MDP7610161.1 hypothetical protein [Candidatus Woesearchaeota archaeon]|tara:strand:- start:118 stop:693 length:576 start_codon:yes stop_codon:yes gene_type:complete
MIQKIKDLLQIKDHIDEIAKAIESNKESITSLTNSITNLKSESSELKEKLSNAIEDQAAFISNFKESSETIEELKEKFENEISDFRLIKNQLPEKIFDQLKEELEPHIESLRTNVKTFNELKSELTKTSEEVNDLNSELTKFINISNNIKAEDFELAKHTKTLEKNDKEKLELVRENEQLKTLIARERRRR